MPEMSEEESKRVAELRTKVQSQLKGLALELLDGGVFDDALNVVSLLRPGTRRQVDACGCRGDCGCRGRCEP